MKNLKPVIASLLLSILIINSNGQNAILKVWSGDAPGSIINKDYFEKVTLADDIPTRYEKVIDPTLTLFLPEAEKATGTAVLICPGDRKSVV